MVRLNMIASQAARLVAEPASVGTIATAAVLATIFAAEVITILSLAFAAR
jgi:hypothetical protein